MGSKETRSTKCHFVADTGESGDDIGVTDGEDEGIGKVGGGKVSKMGQRCRSSSSSPSRSSSASHRRSDEAAGDGDLLAACMMTNSDAGLKPGIHALLI
jgi:hypothetical protein